MTKLASTAGGKVDIARWIDSVTAEPGGLSGASWRLYLNAVRFLYVRVLGWTSFEVVLPIPKRAQLSLRTVRSSLARAIHGY